MFYHKSTTFTLKSALSGLAFFYLLQVVPPGLQAQSTSSKAKETANHLRTLLQQLDASGCLETVPPPILLEEPRYTQGRSNKICFTLPALNSLPVSPDSVKNPFILTLVDDLSGNAQLKFPLPVVLEEDSTYIETINALNGNTLYHYSSALFLPKCLTDCAAVIDSTQLQLLCSPYSDTVSSVQDEDAPKVEQPTIPQVDPAGTNNWWNQSEFVVQADLTDSAGVWQAFLYRRACGAAEWQNAVLDTTYSGELTSTGFLFQQQQVSAFEQNLADGCYQFRIEAKDASHTPESCFGKFELAGNGGTAKPGAEPMLRINIDTTPPIGVDIGCEQIGNAIHLTWTPSVDPGNGSGLAGYSISRDGRHVATLPANQTSFSESFSAETPDNNFVYQVQPFDTLGNAGTTPGNSIICQFRAIFAVTMQSEPEYTAGQKNRVNWSRIPKTETYSLFVARNDDFLSAISYPVQDTTFNVTNLIDGNAYSYWVVAEDNHNRLVYSDTVKSIQDATFPRITKFDIPDRIFINGKNWIKQRNIAITFSARDALPGKIRQIEITENGSVAFVLPVDPAIATLDTTIAYPVQSQDCKAIELAVRVFDAAGNASAGEKTELRLDDAEPASVPQSQCAQLDQANGIGLVWHESTDAADCSGLAGYRILRDNRLIASVAPNVLTYNDIFPINTPTSVFTYQIQSFDSVGNIQTNGGLSECDYIGGSLISINPMSKFTAGLANTVCWNVSGQLVSLTAYIDANCDDTAEDSVTFIGPATAELCHTFDNLIDGQNYCYWVEGEDAQQRNIKSPLVQSTQDNSPPVIENFSFPKAEMLNNQLWAYSAELELRLIASDSNAGEIWNYIISENQTSGVTGAFIDSLSRIDRPLSYIIQTRGNFSQIIDLTIRVIDGAGNESRTSQLRLYLQEQIPPVFAFPNPFNPMHTPITIRVDDQSENEVNVYDFFGNHVRRLNIKENNHDFIWDGRNGDGKYVANGGYICVGTKTHARFKIGVTKRR